MAKFWTGRTGGGILTSILKFCLGPSIWSITIGPMLNSTVPSSSCIFSTSTSSSSSSSSLMDSSGSSFPVPHKKLSLDIKGNKTDVIISSYDDHILVVATQIGSMGTIIHARKEEGVSIDPTFHVSVIFGKRDEPVLVACARQLIEHLSASGSSKPLVLSLGLKDHSVGTLKGIVSTVIENRMW